MNNPNRTVKMVFLFLLLQILFVMVIVPNSIIRNTVDRELEYSGKFVGSDTTTWILTKAQDLYERTMVTSGVEGAILHHLLATDKQRQAESHYFGISKPGDMWYDFMSARLNVLFLIIFLVFFRIYTFMAWWPYLLLWLGASYVDGVLERKARKNSWKHASHVFHGFVMMAIKMAGFVILIVILSPLVVHPLVYPVLGVIVGLMITLSISHMQKTL